MKNKSLESMYSVKRVIKMGTRKWGEKKLAQNFSKRWENSIKLGHTVTKFINSYGFKVFILMKQPINAIKIYTEV